MADYNLNKITSKRSYNITEMAELLNINRKTCQRWIKDDGLRVIDAFESPILVMGADLIDFIKKKRQKRKILLKDDEFFCAKCHKAAIAKAGSEQIVKTGKRIGKDNHEQLKKTGLCECCGTKLNKFL